MAETVLLLVVGSILLIIIFSIFGWVNKKKRRLISEDLRINSHENKALRAIYEQCKKTGAIADDVLLAKLGWKRTQLEIVLDSLKLKKIININRVGDITLTDFGKTYLETEFLPKNP